MPFDEEGKHSLADIVMQVWLITSQTSSGVAGHFRQKAHWIVRPFESSTVT
jgi:hypothetical protein